YLEAKIFKSNTIGTEHLLLSILKDEENVATKALMKFNINYDTVKDELRGTMGNQDEIEFDEPRADFPGSTSDDDDEGGTGSFSGSSTPRKSGESKSKTPVLDNFGRDLTKMAEDDKLDPIVGRELEIER